ncbi:MULTISPECIES: molybdopterin-dependent oxidoreductase [unclassified Curtobacterium]|jgi:DMSO/TMAO reductase YedYZ molybdopterin-dependent catalytic subunit|uniref:molybdopterin-dependent oxidoreductase n=1 Tax=unclassified Curtobacterium TaxID=257496 RepID=UPI00052AA06F|nr:MULTISPECIES: molybdopterin-dependent oxidoreductase [unclassified Curtobacterium]AIV40129.1 molybdopterin-binding protein [Curtobacterium sp. MR_MD2014]MCM3506081.1 molybdopterin-dependent oxidoreductase [Curtobacterium sp. ODYSSEY 48 V2]MDP9737045.1 DMSO/TMAO reductase YedYZ molybdopterin-dependent catalytic subunit [Curtobacterium sp. 260]MDT0209404.1 molybdopterin-dependent oxidoreductase [Curtobacterium sp. BRD11]
MATFTRGFGGRRDDRDDPRIPPGQTLVRDWPVLSAGATPDIEPADWSFSIRTETGLRTWTWDEVHALGVEDVTVDIHCVTHWTKLDMPWRGVSLDRLFADVETSLDFCTVHSFGGYTTNVPRAELLGGRSWIAFEADGAPLTPEHGGPARLLVPHLYFWKSAKWVRGIVMQAEDEPGFWENAGYNMHGDPWKEERYW